MLIRPLSGRAPQTAFPKGAVDAHMHMYLPGYPALPGGPDLPAGLLPDADQYRAFMRWLGIERVIITHGNAHQRDNGNLLACLHAMGDVARGVAVIDRETCERDLDSLSAAGVVGTRIVDLPGGAVGLDEIEIVDAKAASRDWMLAVQFDGNRILDHYDRLKALKSRWVFDHHGKFLAGIDPDGPEIRAVRSLIDGGRCWFKFAGVYESSKAGGPDYADIAAFSRVLASHAPERIVWGSNWPHNLAKTQDVYPDDIALADTVLGWLDGESAVRQALVDNPQALFGLPALGR